MEGLRSPISIGSEIVPDQAREEDVFQCNICMEHPTISVLTTCGHMFCWSCLHGWLQNLEKPCPVCKSTLAKGTIVPIYGAQKGSSKVDDSLPPRPTAPLATSQRAGDRGGDARPAVGPIPDHAANDVDVSIASLNDTQVADPQLETTLRHNHIDEMLRVLQLESLRSTAHFAFRTIRQLYRPSPNPWIAAASDDFDPSVGHSGDFSQGQIDDLHRFVVDVLVPQGESPPPISDFRRSWLPYYVVRNPELSERDHFHDFLESWAVHLHEAWNRAGRPDFEASSGEEIEAPVESLLRISSLEGAVSATNESRGRRASGQRSCGDNSRVNRRRRPY